MLGGSDEVSLGSPGHSTLPRPGRFPEAVPVPTAMQSQTLPNLPASGVNDSCQAASTLVSQETNLKHIAT